MRELTVSVALPAEMGAEPSDVDPSKNSTVPVGAPPLDKTVAVKVTAFGAVTGFRDERSEVADGTLESDWLNGADVLARKFVEPAYDAVIELLALVSALVVNVACPLTSSGAEPNVVPPFLNVTVPVGAGPPDDTVAVNVTAWPKELVVDDCVRVMVVGL